MLVLFGLHRKLIQEAKDITTFPNEVKPNLIFLWIDAAPVYPKSAIAVRISGRDG